MENPGRVARRSQDPWSRTIGKLCLGGDWACANGDLEALGDIAARLGGYTVEPLSSELTALATLCHDHPDHATAVWVRLRSRVLGGAEPS
jgi:hypothetical protein